MRRPNIQGVSDTNINVRVPSSLKAALLKSLEQSEIPNLTSFVAECSRAYILQKKRGEKIDYPLEFVSDRSSDKVNRK